MKNLVNALILAFIATAALPAFANTPQTPEDCQQIYAGDDVKVQACIDSLKK